mgnify:FL=1
MIYNKKGKNNITERRTQRKSILDRKSKLEQLKHEYSSKINSTTPDKCSIYVCMYVIRKQKEVKGILFVCLIKNRIFLKTHAHKLTKRNYFFKIVKGRHWLVRMENFFPKVLVVDQNHLSVALRWLIAKELFRIVYLIRSNSIGQMMHSTERYSVCDHRMKRKKKQVFYLDS